MQVIFKRTSGCTSPTTKPAALTMSTSFCSTPTDAMTFLMRGSWRRAGDVDAIEQLDLVGHRHVERRVRQACTGRAPAAVSLHRHRTRLAALVRDRLRRARRQAQASTVTSSEYAYPVLSPATTRTPTPCDNMLVGALDDAVFEAQPSGPCGTRSTDRRSRRGARWRCRRSVRAGVFGQSEPLEEESNRRCELDRLMSSFNILDFGFRTRVAWLHTRDQRRDESPDRKLAMSQQSPEPRWSCLRRYVGLRVNLFRVHARCTLLRRR